MAKTLRVSDETYSLVMAAVGLAQQEKKKRVSVDQVLKDHFLAGKIQLKKDPNAWKRLEQLIFKGPKNIDCLDIDLNQ